MKERIPTWSEHVEDEIINDGVPGAVFALGIIKDMRDMLAGNSKTATNVTVKFDGSPAIFAGINPENGRFFVGTKSVFNKTPKINYTVRDINSNHSGELAEKLKIALKEFPKLGIQGVIQGDLLFTSTDLTYVNVQGDEHIAFRPNTITYTVPSDSKLAKEILSAKIGVVFHTTYTGQTMQNMSASFGFDANRLKKTKNVWAIDATFKDTSGSAKLTAAKTKALNSKILKIEELIDSLDFSFVNMISKDEKLKLLIKTFANSKVRAGQQIANTKKYAKDLSEFIRDRYQKKMDSLKTDNSKSRYSQELEGLLDFLNKSEQEFVKIFETQKQINLAKLIIVRQLEKVKSLGTFIETENGFKVTAPEGFVAIDNTGRAVKLVDRMEFSQTNFNIQKNWG